MEVAVVGSGPGGLIAARLLALAGVAVTVFERETSFSDRSQGGSLDLHPDSGQFALAKAHLSSAFQSIARYEDQEMYLYDKQGVLRYADRETAGKNRPEVDRGHLRSMLIHSLPAGVIRWGTRVTEVTQCAEGWAVKVADHHPEKFDMVIGADGTWSKVRRLLSDALPRYTGITMIEFEIHDVDARYPALSQKAGRGLTFALGDSKALIAHREANAHLGGYIGLRCEADWFTKNGLDRLAPDAARRRLCRQFAGWSDDLLA